MVFINCNSQSRGPLGEQQLWLSFDWVSLYALNEHVHELLAGWRLFAQAKSLYHCTCRSTIDHKCQDSNSRRVEQNLLRHFAIPFGNFFTFQNSFLILIQNSPQIFKPAVFNGRNGQHDLNSFVFSLVTACQCGNATSSRSPSALASTTFQSSWSFGSLGWCLS